jgi:hypothetical protein
MLAAVFITMLLGVLAIGLLGNLFRFHLYLCMSGVGDVRLAHAL